MPTSAIKFEVRIPETDPNLAPACNTFLASLASLTPYAHTQVYVYDGVNPAPTIYGLVYGILSSSQATTALGFLSTLNTSLQSAGGTTVQCLSWTVNEQP